MACLQMESAWRLSPPRIFRESRTGTMVRKLTSGSFRRGEARLENSHDFAQEFSISLGHQTASTFRPSLVELTLTFGKCRLKIRTWHASSRLDRPTKTLPHYPETDDGSS